MSLQRLIIAILLTFGLISSTIGAAYGQGRMVGAHSITICSPDGVHDIILGADGEPVPVAHECHDCCFASLDDQERPEIPSVIFQKFNRVSLSVAAITCISKPTSGANARAPPYLV